MDAVPYAAGLRLTYLAATNWRQIDGTCALRGIDPLTLPYERFLNLVYAIYVENMDKPTRDKFDLQIFMPMVDGRADPDAVDDDYVARELEQFRAFASELGGG